VHDCNQALRRRNPTFLGSISDFGELRRPFR
jgi:hypothetical protein